MADRGGLGYKKGSRREVKGKDLKELKELKKPAEAVKLTMGALCVLLGEKPEKVEVDGKKVDDYWEPATKVPVDSSPFIQMFAHGRPSCSIYSSCFFSLFRTVRLSIRSSVQLSKRGDA